MKRIFFIFVVSFVIIGCSALLVSVGDSNTNTINQTNLKDIK